MARGELLYQLQNLDLELEEGQRRVAEIQASLKETEALRRARRAVTAAEETHREWLTKTRDLELETESLSGKIAASEKRLYSGKVTNPKELEDIQEEIASVKRRRRTLEDELLEAMVYGEQAEEELEVARTGLADTEAQWHADQKELRDELAALETRLVEAQKERENVRQALETEALNLYDSLQNRFGSIAVATLRDGVCGFCAVAPPSTKLRLIRSGRELVQCSNCGRILLAA